jgi:hypothetical protein
MEKSKYITSTFMGGGYFSNQLFKYFTLFTLSEDYKLEIQTPEWIGQKIFDIPISKIDESIYYTPITEGRDPNDICGYHQNYSKIINQGEKFKETNFDVAPDCNTFYHTSWYARHKEKLLDHCSFKKSAFDNIKEQIDKLKEDISCDKIITIHARMADDYHAKWKFPENTYKQGAKFLIDYYQMQGFKNPKIFICTDRKKEARSIFSDFDPIFLEDHNVKFDVSWENEYNGSLDFLPDYFLITQSDCVLASDSTFAYSACMFNQVPNAKFFRPSQKEMGLVPFDPWDTWLLDFRTWRFQ